MHAKRLVTPPPRWSENEAFWKGEGLLYGFKLCLRDKLYNPGITRKKKQKKTNNCA